MPRRSLISILAALILVPLAYFFVWPASFGGRASYAIVSGISMEPGYETGDLVIVRQADDYEIGDVVLYASPDGDVIHRIVGGDAETGFITQGDNKSQVDPWQPKPASIRGREWLHVPNVGGWIYNTRAVLPVPLVGGLLAALLYGRGRRRRRKRRNSGAVGQRESEEVGMQENPPRRWSTTQKVTAVAATISGAFALGFAWLGWTALRTDSTVDVVSDAGSVTHEVAFSYTAFAEGSSVVYPDGQVGPVEPPPAPSAAPIVPEDPDADAEDGDPTLVPPPQPLFRELIDRMELGFAYSHSSHVEADLSGTYRVDVELSTPDGWTAPLGTLVENTPFDDVTEFVVPLEFDEAGRRVLEVSNVTGVLPGFFNLTVVPTITVAGTAGERDVERTIEESFVIGVGDFIIDPDQSLLRIIGDPAVVTTSEPAHVDVLGFSPTVSDARTIALIGLLVFAAFVAFVLWLGWGRSSPDRIRFLYGSRLVELGAASVPAGQIVQVASFTELRRLAARESRSILHQELPSGTHRYLVADGDVTYVVEIDPDGVEPAVHPAEPLALTASTGRDASRSGDVSPAPRPVIEPITPIINGHADEPTASAASQEHPPTNGSVPAPHPTDTDAGEDLDELLKQIGVDVGDEA